MRLTDDAFLGGRLRLLQPQQGYRAGMDPVLLAAFVDAHSGARVLELGCGVGTALLCLGVRVPECALFGLELQAEYAALARENAQRNGICATILEGDVQNMPAALKAQSFDHVLVNPPYFHSAHHAPAKRQDRATARNEDAVPLADWVMAGAKRLRPKGWFHMILCADRLTEALGAFAAAQLGGATVLPLAAREGRAAHLVLMRAQRLSRAPLRLLPFITLHSGEKHLKDGNDLQPKMEKILRDGQALKI